MDTEIHRKLIFKCRDIGRLDSLPKDKLNQIDVFAGDDFLHARSNHRTGASIFFSLPKLGAQKNYEKDELI